MTATLRALAGAWALTAATSVAACGPEPVTVERTPFSVSTDAEAWSGGTLVLRSQAFQGLDSLPTVTVGSDTLGVLPFGADSVLVSLPDTNDSITLSVRLATGASRAAGPVRVHGFAGTYFLPSVDGSFLPWPGGEAPTALAYVGGRLALVDLGAPSGNPVPMLPDTGLGSTCGRGPMPSAADPWKVLISHPGASGSCGPLIATSLAAPATPPDTGPAPYYQWPAIQLGGGHWLIDRKQLLSVVTGSPESGFTPGPDILCSMPWGFAVSPRGDRVAPRGCYVPAPNPGLPVFDVTSGDVAYYLPALDQSDEAAFSDGGDTLFRAGGTYTAGTEERRLEAIEATSGSLLAGTSIEPQAWALSVEPARPWIYVAGPSGPVLDVRPVVEVIDRRTMAHAATLRVPASALDASIGYGTFDYVTLLSPLSRRLYLAIHAGISRVQVLQFDLMP